MNREAYSLKFYGRDFTPIIEDLKEEVPFGKEKTLNKEEQLRIIIKFLDLQKNNIEGLIVDFNHKKNNDYELYSILNDEYYWSGLVGVIKGKIPQLFESDIKGDNELIEENNEYENVEITIQIQSRFDVNSGNKLAKPYFLSTMLLQCKSDVNNQIVPNNSDEFFFDLLLLYLFKEKANKCYMKGLYKTYQRFEKNDDKLKGTIDISRYIRLNLGLENGKVSYSYRENTVDNYLNYLILAAYYALKKKYPETTMSVYFDPLNVNMKLLIDTLSSKINHLKYDNRTLIMKNLRNISHPFYTEYDELRIISLRILRNEGVSMFDGEVDEINGILLCIPDLWESYLEHLLLDSSYNLYIQGYQHKSINIIDYNDNGIYKQKTYPDFVFSSYINKKEIPFMILDAKFKPNWGNVLNEQKPISSVLDDYNKCIRDMNSISAHACGTIFPTNIDLTSKQKEILKHNISEHNKIDKFYTFPILVPLSDIENGGYSQWFFDFKDKNKEIIKLLKEYINQEKQFTVLNYDLINKLNNLRRNGEII